MLPPQQPPGASMNLGRSAMTVQVIGPVVSSGRGVGTRASIVAAQSGSTAVSPGVPPHASRSLRIPSVAVVPRRTLASEHSTKIDPSGCRSAQHSRPPVTARSSSVAVTSARSRPCGSSNVAAVRSSRIEPAHDAGPGPGDALGSASGVAWLASMSHLPVCACSPGVVPRRRPAYVIGRPSMLAPLASSTRIASTSSSPATGAMGAESNPRFGSSSTRPSPHWSTRGPIGVGGGSGGGVVEEPPQAATSTPARSAASGPVDRARVSSITSAGPARPTTWTLHDQVRRRRTRQGCRPGRRSDSADRLDRASGSARPWAPETARLYSPARADIAQR
jgi:hypothetical protein